MSSKRRIRRKQCGKKIRYVTQEEAKAAMGSMFRRCGYPGAMNIYHCKFCGGWHIGHRKGAKIYRV